MYDWGCDMDVCTVEDVTPQVMLCMKAEPAAITEHCIALFNTLGNPHVTPMGTCMMVFCRE